MLKIWKIAPVVSLLLLTSLPGLAASARIDLVEFGRVIEMPDQPTRPASEADELVRGTDGWDAVRGSDGLYTIGVEWDSPRELAEVNIEFRHAIANREQIKVQYWKSETTGTQAESGAQGGSAKGQWLTPKTEWWAGDRDVSFAFLPEDHETPGKPGITTRRTMRLRFICGKDDLPPVRFLRAYGPDAGATDTFEFRFDEDSALRLPVAVRTTNGFIMGADGKTKMTSAILRERATSLEIRYGLTELDSPNLSELTLSPIDKPREAAVFHPAEVARRGQVRAAESGVMMEKRGGKVPQPRGKAASRP